MVHHFQLSAVVRLSECRKTHCFYSRKRKHSGCQWSVEAVAGAVGPAISGVSMTDSTSRKYSKIYNVWLTHQYLSWFANAPSMPWPGIEVVTIHFLRIIALSTVNIFSDRFPCLPAWPQCSRRWVHPKESWKLQRFVWGIQNKYFFFFLHIGFSKQYGQKRFLYQMLTTRLLFRKPIWPIFLERLCRESLQSARWFLPKIIPYI